MKKLFFFATATVVALGMASCQSAEAPKVADAAETTATAGQSGVQDDDSQKDVVKVAASSKDHSTLVAAVKAGELVDALSNAGPFTVFAPTNAAFDKLPKGTVEDLLKPENKAKLQDILQYHVYVGSLKTDLMQDGQTLNQVNGGNISITKKDGKVLINNSAVIIASIPASNGIIHVIDAVLLPPSK
ncbi:MAG: fasciclin domain-containing protein [Chitinophagaceae bacterium]|nr:MAG: fasciclin domain-containing protein [Chitinophagaceae bacterium]